MYLELIKISACFLYCAFSLHGGWDRLYDMSYIQNQRTKCVWTPHEPSQSPWWGWSSYKSSTAIWLTTPLPHSPSYWRSPPPSPSWSLWQLPYLPYYQIQIMQWETVCFLIWKSCISRSPKKIFTKFNQNYY